MASLYDTWYGQCLEAINTFLKKRFPRLNILKAVSLRIVSVSIGTTNSEKMKMKNAILPTTFGFSLPSSLGFPADFFLNCSTQSNC